jgi:hypothetical protein
MMKSELTNKDGVPIRVAQCWRCSDEDRGDWEVVGLHSLTDDGPPLVIIWEIGFGDSYHAKTASWFNDCMLFSDPTLGDMSEWRIVTAEEKAKHKAPSGVVEAWATDSSPLLPVQWTIVAEGWTMIEEFIYRVPLGYVFEAEKGPQCDKCHGLLGGNTFGGFDKARKEVWCSKCYANSLFNPATTTCPDCNKAAKVCECGCISDDALQFPEQPVAPDTLELLGEVFDYDTVRDTINALIKRTEALK